MIRVEKIGSRSNQDFEGDILSHYGKLVPVSSNLWQYPFITNIIGDID